MAATQHKPTESVQQSDIAVKLDEVASKIQGLTDALGLGEMHLSTETQPVKRRRSEEELRTALATLASGVRRSANDESEQALNDCISELFHLRGIVVGLMQSNANIQKNAMMAVRAITGQ